MINSLTVIDIREMILKKIVCVAKRNHLNFTFDWNGRIREDHINF